MTKKVYRSVFLAAFVTLVACLAIILGVVYEYFYIQQENQLKVEAQLAAQGVYESKESFFDGLKTGDLRITWIDADGTVLYDTMNDASSMENHALREEVKQAYETGWGKSSRYSETLLEKNMYYAVKIDGGTIVRVSSTVRSPYSFIVSMIQPIVLVLTVTAILSFFLANRLAKNITKPLETLDLDNPLSNNTYEELAPFLTRIEKQNRKIEKQKNDIQRNRNEFDAITASMSEGLILLNEKDETVYINACAAKLLDTDTSCIGKNILEIDRSAAMNELLEQCKSGRHFEKEVKLAAGCYQVDASPVVTNKETVGAAILIFDVTDKANAEQMRREFTANVSHELKTPLHTISGCAELIQNGLVKAEDVKGFAQQIHSQAQRMTTLIDDIIRLSRLDEGVEQESKEPVDILEVAENAARTLEMQAKEKDISVKVSGENVTVNGITQLVYGIAYNLCDNAIKYNKPGGKVDVTVKKDGEKAILSVKDNGIGIPSEHQSRIFERFYRVDKSHSKEIGGTGLGLSIVKHSAQLLDAKIELDSTVGEGTEIRVIFPGD